MKKTVFLLTLLLLTILKIQAQNAFAPIGAEWHYQGELVTYNYWLSQTAQDYAWNDDVKSINDTTILGQNCRIPKIVRSERHVGSTAISINEPTYQYVYDLVDTTLYFDKDSLKFLPLYVWNVPVGDTIHLPHLNKRGHDFFFVVDSVVNVLYDTSHLKTYYVTSFMDTVNAFGEIQNWGGSRTDVRVSHGVFIEKLGGIAGLFPSFVSTNPDGISEILNPAGRLLCYSDISTSIKTVNYYSCDTIPALSYTSINEIEKSNLQLTIAPNPASTQINIKSQFAFESNSWLTAMDILGRTATAPLPLDKKKDISLQVYNWTNGIYLLEIQVGSQAYYQKIVVQH